MDNLTDRQRFIERLHSYGIQSERLRTMILFSQNDVDKNQNAETAGDGTLRTPDMWTAARDVVKALRDLEDALTRLERGTTY